MIDLDHLKKQLEAMQCREHQLHPEVKISNAAVKLSTCCVAFQKELRKVAVREVNRMMESETKELFSRFTSKPS